MEAPDGDIQLPQLAGCARFHSVWLPTTSVNQFGVPVHFLNACVKLAVFLRQLICLLPGRV
jgi:hypothetical protein